jgi:hypothetical protein
MHVKNKLMLGIWGHMVSVPPILWEREVEKSRKKIEAEMDFMSPDHRRVHHCAVRELPRAGKPMPPESVASELDLPIDRANQILDELEKRMTFLFRNEEGAVVWAYPVTVDKTPHHLAFSTGEQLYGA